LKEKAFSRGLIDIPKVFTSQSPEHKKIPHSAADRHSISTLLADIEAEFQRREQEKTALFVKWVNEGIIMKSRTLLIAQVISMHHGQLRSFPLSPIQRCGNLSDIIDLEVLNQGMNVIVGM
jgi:hypothetical protein